MLLPLLRKAIKQAKELSETDKDHSAPLAPSAKDLNLRWHTTQDRGASGQNYTKVCSINLSHADAYRDYRERNIMRKSEPVTGSRKSSKVATSKPSSSSPFRLPGPLLLVNYKTRTLRSQPAFLVNRFETSCPSVAKRR